MTTWIGWRFFGRSMHLVPLFVLAAAGHAVNDLSWWRPDWLLTPVWWLLLVGVAMALNLGVSVLFAWSVRLDGGPTHLGPFVARGLLLASVGTLTTVASALGTFEPPIRTWMSFGGIVAVAVGAAWFATDQFQDDGEEGA